MALSGADRETANAYLRDQLRLADDQRRMLRLQMEEMRERNSYEISHLRWRTFTDRMKGALQIMTAVVGLAVVSGLGAMVWNAAHSEGVVIESFAVPPDLAARGLSGEVVTGKLLDRFNVLKNANANQLAIAQGATTSAANEVRVEIPETGISLGELYRFLRRWLGHETMVGGDVVRASDGITVTVRVSERESASFSGPEARLDDLMEKGAEHVYEQTQPQLYVNYLRFIPNPPVARMEAILRQATTGPSVNRAGAWNVLGIIYDQFKGDLLSAIPMARRAIALNPESGIPRSNVITYELRLGQYEAALAELPQAIEVTERNSAGFTPEGFRQIRDTLGTRQAMLRGDYAEAARLLLSGVDEAGSGTRQYNRLLTAAIFTAKQHDGAARALMSQMAPPTGPASLASLEAARVGVEFALQNWPGVLGAQAQYEKSQAQAQPGVNLSQSFAAGFWPSLALARAKTGDIKSAETLIAATPGDCYPCLVIRAQIAELRGHHGRADWWFARALMAGPSIPFAHEERGRSLLDRGKPDDAIAQFQLATQKGPHFADPLEGWGEALMAKNQSHRALAKFAEAEKYAPNWGRLHLKWGQALLYAGKKDEAKVQFARAAQLDLTPSEKSELARHP